MKNKREKTREEKIAERVLYEKQQNESVKLTLDDLSYQ